MPDSDPTLELLVRIVDAIGDLADSLVFVGGCATNRLTTVQRAEMTRVTDDVDVIVDVRNLADYHRAEASFHAIGFTPDPDPEAPICRLIREGLTIDLMPTSPVGLGFHNQWYGLAFETASSLELPGGRTIRIVRAPVFVATKLDALASRGMHDLRSSHDMEDIVTVVDGREELVDETRESEPDLRCFISRRMRDLLASADFMQALGGHLPGDHASQGRLPELLRRLRALSELD